MASQWWLGHDKPTYKVEGDFLMQNGLWCHAKNQEALVEMVELGVHCFWHQNDEVTLTSRKFLWTYPGKKLTSRSIAVMPERVSGWELEGIAGICSDYVENC